MTKQDHIQYWLNTSQQDWEIVADLLKSKRYVHCLFFAHLALEKLCKAHWVKDNESNHPPRIHNLVRILADTKVRMPEENMVFLERFNDFQIEGRYPDYMMRIYKVCTLDYTLDLLNTAKQINQCLTETLQ